MNLSLLASEARAVRKAKLEEKVAKAPVKMLLPVGTLILPAMLILIMGPIMLDLMEGFFFFFTGEVKRHFSLAVCLALIGAWKSIVGKEVRYEKERRKR